MPDGSDITNSQPAPASGPLRRFQGSVLKVWHSPTVTTWANQLVTMSRLLIVTPLILTRFNQTEIAAWFVLGSINFFGQAVAASLTITFNRMVAFAMGGAQSLARIDRSSIKRQVTSAEPNWEMMGRVYRTLGAIQLILATVTGTIAAGCAIFGVQGLVRNYDDSFEIWLGVGIMVVSSAIGFTQQRYGVVVQGMGKVAVVNRVNALFNVIAIVAGVITILLGGRFLALVIVMQSFSLLGGVRTHLLMRIVLGEHSSKLRGLHVDREVFGWAWDPIWKRFFGKLSAQGVTQLSGIIFARLGDPVTTSMYLLGLRLITTITESSQAPYSSHSPKMARMLAEGRINEVRDLSLRRMRYVLTLLALAHLGVGLVASVGLKVIEAKITFLPLSAWVLFGFFALIDRINNLGLATSALGNHIAFFGQQVACGLASLVLILLLIKPFGVYGAILAGGLPSLLILNIGPSKLSSEILQIPLFPYLRRIAAPSLCIFLFSTTLFLSFPHFPDTIANRLDSVVPHLKLHFSKPHHGEK